MNKDMSIIHKTTHLVLDFHNSVEDSPNDQTCHGDEDFSGNTNIASIHEGDGVANVTPGMEVSESRFFLVCEQYCYQS